MTLPFAKTILVVSMIFALASIDEASARKGASNSGGKPPSPPPQQFRTQPLKSPLAPKKPATTIAKEKGKGTKPITTMQKNSHDTLKNVIGNMRE